MTAYFFLFIAIFAAASSQLLTKYHMLRAGEMPTEIKSQALFLLSNLFSVPIVLAIVLTFVSGVCWLGVLSKMTLSESYPFMLLVFPIVVFASTRLFDEQLNGSYFVGGTLVLFGLYLMNR